MWRLAVDGVSWQKKCVGIFLSWVLGAGDHTHQAKVFFHEKHEKHENLSHFFRVFRGQLS